MSSRVIHIRLDDWVLLGCHDIMKAQGNVDNIPMATIARQVLTALVRKLQNTKQIPIYSKEEIVKRALELYEGAYELDFEFNLNEIVKPEEETSDENMLELVKEVQRQIEHEGVPDKLAQPVTISEKPISDEVFKSATLNILNVEHTPFTDVKKAAPKDRFIEWADTQNDIVQAAVCIAYDGLPKTLWGTDKAEVMIKGLLEKHRGN